MFFNNLTKIWRKKIFIHISINFPHVYRLINCVFLIICVIMQWALKNILVWFGRPTVVKCRLNEHHASLNTLGTFANYTGHSVNATITWIIIGASQKDHNCYGRIFKKYFKYQKKVSHLHLANKICDWLCKLPYYLVTLINIASHDSH